MVHTPRQSIRSFTIRFYSEKVNATLRFFPEWGKFFDKEDKICIIRTVFQSVFAVRGA